MCGKEEAWGVGARGENGESGGGWVGKLRRETGEIIIFGGKNLPHSLTRQAHPLFGTKWRCS
jgi:hypothetical protein